jgi:hypothetical protein
MGKFWGEGDVGNRYIVEDEVEAECAPGKVFSDQS